MPPGWASRSSWRADDAGSFAEVPLGALGVVRAVHIAQLFKRILECLDGLEGGYRDLHIDDRLGGQAGHRG